ncbi:putative oxidoreductase MhqP [Anoxybacillus sp. BCO1]|nr:putative oxidoreductase MhqP [Anoxybacillus sp. BCO1]
MALIAGLAEFVGGLLFALGLFTPFAALLLAATMVIAIVKVHAPNGFWVTQNGFEYNFYFDCCCDRYRAHRCRRLFTRCTHKVRKEIVP